MKYHAGTLSELPKQAARGKLPTFFLVHPFLQLHESYSYIVAIKTVSGNCIYILLAILLENYHNELPHSYLSKLKTDLSLQIIQRK